MGEAFSRLDPLAQQVMQALAVFPVPVPAVAVDYLLQPYRAAIDAAPVLGRLVNMAFVRRDAGRYYLHQVDRDYALARIPAGEPADRDTDPPPFTQRRCGTAARTTSRSPAPPGRPGKPSTTSRRNWPNSNSAAKAATTTPPPPSWPASTSTTCWCGATTAP